MKRHLIEHDSAEWHEFRMRGLGGSEIASVLGIDPYRCSLELFHQKLGLCKPFEGNQATHWGQSLEETVADAWRYWDGTEAGWISNRQSGTKVRQCRRMRGYVTNPKYPWLFFSPDRIGSGWRFQEDGSTFVRQGGFYLECKTIGSYAYAALDHVIPIHYTAQVQTGMIMLGYDYGELAILIGGNNFKVFPLYANLEWQQDIIEKTRQFWISIINARLEIDLKTAPALAGNPNMTNAELRELVSQFEPTPTETEMQAYCKYVGIAYTEEGEGMATGTDWQLTTARMHKNKSKAAKIAKQDQDILKADLVKAIQATGCEGIDFGQAGKITWKPNKNGTWTLRNSVKI